MRAVVDTNVVVSALISARSPPDQVLQAWREGSFQLILSPQLLDELERVLARAKVAARVRWTERKSTNFVRGLRRKATVVTPKAQLEVITGDPDDNRVLEAAVEGRADYIVTGDRDLLDLAEHEDTRVVTPTRFLAILVEARHQ